jgi:hypothetical protein
VRAQLDIFGMSWVFILEGRPQQDDEELEHHEVLSSTGFQPNEPYEEEED